MFARFDGGVKVLRTKSWRGGNENDIDSRIDELLEGMESGELTLGGDLNTLLKRWLRRDVIEGVGDLSRKGISESPEANVWIGIERLNGSSGAAAATTDETDFDDDVVVVCGLGARDVGCTGEDAGGGSGFQEAASVVWHDLER